MNFTDDIKKIMLAGVGAVATTAEKGQELIDMLVKKGEMTVEQGKVLNEELKRNRKSATKPGQPEAMADVKLNADVPKPKAPQDELMSKVEKMTREQRAALKAKLDEMDAGK